MGTNNNTLQRFSKILIFRILSNQATNDVIATQAELPLLQPREELGLRFNTTEEHVNNLTSVCY